MNKISGNTYLVYGLGPNTRLVKLPPKPNRGKIPILIEENFLYPGEKFKGIIGHYEGELTTDEADKLLKEREESGEDLTTQQARETLRKLEIKYDFDSLRKIYQPEGELLWEMRLTENQSIHGISLLKGNLVTLEDFTFYLFMVILSKEQYVHGVKFAKGTQLWFNREGLLDHVWLSEDQEVLVPGVCFAKETYLYFRANGTLFFGILSKDKDQEVQGVPLPKGSTVYFINNKLSSVVLSQDQEIQGIRYDKGKEVRFAEDGRG